MGNKSVVRLFLQRLWWELKEMARELLKRKP